MKKVNWNEIDTVLLDMDGTLIDQHHEDFFWDYLLPKEYAKKHKMTNDEAFSRLHIMYKEKEGSQDWGNINAWEKELGMDLKTLRKKTKPYIKLHPHTIRFLKFLKKTNKRIFLVTAANQQDIDFEMSITKMGKYFDGMFSQAEIGFPKKDNRFWEFLKTRINFDPKRTLLVDDNKKVIDCAVSYGIKYCIFKIKYSSKKKAHEKKDNAISIHHLDDLF